MPNVTIAATGVNGFVGQHLVRELVEHGAQVVGLGRDAEPEPDIIGALTDYISVDLTKSWPRLPEISGVIHLAGLAAVGESFDNPQLYIEVNSSMITQLGEHMLRQEKRPRVVIVSSGGVYSHTAPSPFAEDSPTEASSPYIVSKLLVESQAAYYRGRGIDTVVARPFNHAGPGQSAGFLIPDLIAEARRAKESQTAVRVGNLDTARDYTDVRDVVAAYRMLVSAERLANSIYNISSGVAVSGHEILGLVLEQLDAPLLPITIDRSRFRPTDAPRISGDSTRIRGELGWAPGISLKRTIRDSVSH